MRTKLLTIEDEDSIVTLEEAMEHSRITDSYDELVIQGCLDAAHDLVQQYLNRKLYPATFGAFVETYRNRISLPYAPIGSVSKITCENVRSVEIDLVEGLDWKYELISESVRFLVDYSDHSNFIIYYSGGYQTVSDIPKSVKHAIKMTFATLYENREDTITGTQINEVPVNSRRVLAAHRIRSQC